MSIQGVKTTDKSIWNEFVHTHYPPVGAFMQAWEWGDFQKKMGREVERYFVIDRTKPVAAFTLIHHNLSRGLKYGYAARGPVIASGFEGRTVEILLSIKKWAKEKFPDFLFIRLEPPIANMPDLPAKDFKKPGYYVQPRHNHVIELEKSEEDIIRGLHPSTRSNLSRAEKRGVTVKFETKITDDKLSHFKAMIRDTISRNSGKNAYPDKNYFDSFFSEIPGVDVLYQPTALSIGGFYGYHHEEPAATHFVLFFGNTATYIYGASYSRHLNSKVTTYLHWAAIREAKRRGMKYYDIGGVDEVRWPSLTEFKRQFRGREFSYVGNIDIPIQSIKYKLYNCFRALKAGLDYSSIKLSNTVNGIEMKQIAKKGVVTILVLCLGFGFGDIVFTG